MENKTIVFIHGLSENSSSWSAWKSFFEQHGYTCHAPNYPYHEGKPIDLRNDPNPKLQTLTLIEVINYYQNFIEKLDEKPILIGHSMGGLITQKLVEKNLASKGICISSAPPNGIFTFKWSFLKSNFPTINPFGSPIFLGSKKWFHYNICNTLHKDLADICYEEIIVPESKLIPINSAGQQGRIDSTKPHAPLLFISGGKDKIIPKILNIKNYKAYTNKNSVTEYKEFPNRSHCICNKSGWQEVAQFTLDWITNSF